MPLALLGICAGCAGGAVERSARLPQTQVVEAPATKPEPKSADASLISMPEALSLESQDLGPQVLMPTAVPDDAEVMSIGGFAIHKSHLYDRLFEVNPFETKKNVDSLVFDILLAKEAQERGIYVDAKQVDEMIATEESSLAKQVEEDWGGVLTFDEYLQQNLGVNLEVHRLLQRRRLARRLFRYYVIRYLALLEDRVQVRIISHRDRATIDKAMGQAREGADFHSLALRISEHTDTQRRGGLVAPFSRSSKWVFAAAAFELAPGEVSDVLEVTNDGVTHHYLLYCTQHMPGRQVPFREVKEELDADWLKNPIINEEANDLYVRLRSASEALKKEPEDR